MKKVVVACLIAAIVISWAVMHRYISSDSDEAVSHRKANAIYRLPQIRSYRDTYCFKCHKTGIRFYRGVPF